MGLVDSPGSRQAAEDIARALAPDRPIINDIEIEEIWPSGASDVTPQELGIDGQADLSILAEEIEPSFEDQSLLVDPLAASGPSSSADDLVDDGDVTYFPPTDPVVRVNEDAEPEVLGGFSPSSDSSIEVARSADGTIGDEALADAVRRELQEDATTADLEIDVSVVHGIARLRGRVADIADAENAEAVARSVTDLRDVIDELEVTHV
jgi:hypothetical protein